MTRDPKRLILCRTPLNAYISTLSPERQFSAWQAVLTAELSLHLGTDHAAILAVPEPGPQGLTWVTSGERAAPLNTLTSDAQETLLKVLGGIFRDIEQLAESGQAPALAAAWPALRRIPHEGFVYAVDGRPVLAAWGHAPATASTWPDPLARLMLLATPLFPAATAATTERIHRRPAATPFILGLAAAVFLLGLILPGFGLWPFHCVLAAETISLSDQTNQALLQNTQIADQQATEPTPGITPQYMAQNLPEDDWNAGKLSMLDGCWHLTSNMKLYFENTDQPHPIATWLICFDKTGKGTQTVTFQDGDACTGPLQASFTGDHQLLIDEPTECSSDNATIVMSHWICNRTSDSEAQCTRTDKDGGGTSQGVFQR
jgi:hypothetical protein